MKTPSHLQTSPCFLGRTVLSDYIGRRQRIKLVAFFQTVGVSQHHTYKDLHRHPKACRLQIQLNIGSEKHPNQTVRTTDEPYENRTGNGNSGYKNSICRHFDFSSAACRRSYRASSTGSKLQSLGFTGVGTPNGFGRWRNLVDKTARRFQRVPAPPVVRRVGINSVSCTDLSVSYCK